MLFKIFFLKSEIENFIFRMNKTKNSSIFNKIYETSVISQRQCMVQECNKEAHYQKIMHDWNISCDYRSAIYLRAVFDNSTGIVIIYAFETSSVDQYTNVTIFLFLDLKILMLKLFVV